MDDPKPKSSRLMNWYDELVAPDEWEAPDRSFVGHRDSITRNLSRYRFASTYLDGSCLEVGTGRGYGLEMYRDNVQSWVGVDIAHLFLVDAKTLFQEFFVQASGRFLPFSRQTFNSIVTFEVIEHIEDDIGYLCELRRLMKDDGTLAISTPNRSAVSGETPKPLDRFHVREYSYSEFNDLLQSVFSDVQVFSQFERTDQRGVRSKWINRIPVRLRSSLPAIFQDRISVFLREPLKLSHCKFIYGDSLNAQNYLAMCKI